MARKLRIQYPNALYHVINRGNYRRDLFESVGAAEAFLTALLEATTRYGWRLHAYVLMRNHYHLAIETPKPNLVEGMHWLQSTIATRFNRYRQEQGHLFQGRYKSIVLEDAAALARVVDYIHLNPVRAKVVLPEHVANYRWSSLRRFTRGPRAAGMVAEDWLSVRDGWSDGEKGWQSYQHYLVAVGRDEAEQERRGLTRLSIGWAIGTRGWRQSMAEEHAHLRLNPGLGREESRALNEAAWERHLTAQLSRLRPSMPDVRTRPRRLPWKVELARNLRQEAGASVAWIARRLDLGKPSSVRSYLARSDSGQNQQTAA